MIQFMTGVELGLTIAIAGTFLASLLFCTCNYNRAKARGRQPGIKSGYCVPGADAV